MSPGEPDAGLNIKRHARILIPVKEGPRSVEHKVLLAGRGGRKVVVHPKDIDYDDSDGPTVKYRVMENLRKSIMRDQW